MLRGYTIQIIANVKVFMTYKLDIKGEFKINISINHGHKTLPNKTS